MNEAVFPACGLVSASVRRTMNSSPVPEIVSRGGLRGAGDSCFHSDDGLGPNEVLPRMEQGSGRQGTLLLMVNRNLLRQFDLPEDELHQELAAAFNQSEYDEN